MLCTRVAARAPRARDELLALERLVRNAGAPAGVRQLEVLCPRIADEVCWSSEV